MYLVCIIVSIYYKKFNYIHVKCENIYKNIYKKGAPTLTKMIFFIQSKYDRVVATLHLITSQAYFYMTVAL